MTPSMRDEALEAMLRAAVTAKGPAYVPRTRHRHADGSPTYVNRLVHETSPYLLQHAHNPVDWYPWGDEAFEEARRRGCPVFLSIGYATCHWCHVMEEESFEDLEIARVLNEGYVAVKVDREERPDVDDIYMTALGVTGTQGGWPLTMILTPDGKPIFGGTYFPPEDKKVSDGTIPGMKSILARVIELDKKERPELEKQAEEAVAPIRGIDLMPSTDSLKADAVAGQDGTPGAPEPVSEPVPKPDEKQA